MQDLNMNYFQIIKSIFKFSFSEDLTIKFIKNEGDIVAEFISKDFIKSFIPSLLFLTALYYMLFQEIIVLSFNFNNELSHLILTAVATFSLILMYGGYLFDKESSSKVFDLMSDYKKIIKIQNKKYKKENNKILESYKHFKNYKSDKWIFYGLLVPIDLVFCFIYIALIYFLFKVDNIYWVIFLYIILIVNLAHSKIKILYSKWRVFSPSLTNLGYVDNPNSIVSSSGLNLIIMQNNTKIYYSSELEIYYIQHSDSDRIYQVELKLYDINKYLKLSFEQFEREVYEEHYYEVDDIVMEVLKKIYSKTISQNSKDFLDYFQNKKRL